MGGDGRTTSASCQDDGCTLEQIRWYHDKRREYPSRELWPPSILLDDVECICQHRWLGVWHRPLMSRLRERCLPPVAVGDVTALSPKDSMRWRVRFVADFTRAAQVWHFPDNGCRVGTTAGVVAVDIGAARLQATSSHRRDRPYGCVGQPEIAAQWRGHIDHDLLTMACRVNSAVV